MQTSCRRSWHGPTADGGLLADTTDVAIIGQWPGSKACIGCFGGGDAPYTTCRSRLYGLVSEYEGFTLYRRPASSAVGPGGGIRVA